MKYLIVEPFAVKTPQGKVTFPIGKILELSENQAANLTGKICHADELNLFRWFAVESDRVFRLSIKSDASWKQHMVHIWAAVAFCKAGDLSMGSIELIKSLAALQGVANTQQELIAA